MFTSMCVFVCCVNNFAILLRLNVSTCMQAYTRLLCHLSLEAKRGSFVLAAQILNGCAKRAKESTSRIAHTCIAKFTPIRVCVCVYMETINVTTARRQQA